MLLKPVPIEVPQADPYKNDALNRRAGIDAISTLIKNAPKPFVLTINAPWGSGKTTFLRILNATLIQTGNTPVYFSAWETDYAADPLIAFLGEVQKYYSNPSDPNGKYNAILSKLKKAGSTIAKRTIPFLAKAATGGILDFDKTTEDEIANLTSELSKDAVESYLAQGNLITEFKDLVKRMAALESEADGRGIVFLVDELDRCRPDYSITFLERVKHLLSVENTIFIFALDRVQLENSVKAVYGAGIDAKEYLRRFIDLEFNLTSITTETYIESLIQRFKFHEHFSGKVAQELKNELDSLRKTIKHFFSIFSFSLRAQESFCSYVSLALITTSEKHYIFVPLLSILIAVKLAMPETYQQFVFGDMAAKTFIESIIDKYPGFLSFLTDHIGIITEIQIALSKINIYQASEGINSYIESPPRNLPYDDDRVQLIRRVAQRYNFDSVHPSLEYVGKKIELLGAFGK